MTVLTHQRTNKMLPFFERQRMVWKQTGNHVIMKLLKNTFIIKKFNTNYI